MKNDLRGEVTYFCCCCVQCLPEKYFPSTVKRLKTMKNDMRGEVTCLLLLLYSVLAGRILPEGIFLASTEHSSNKNKLLHLSNHFSLFLTFSLLFKCRFVAWRRGFPWKFTSCCLCHNKQAFFWIFYVFGSYFRTLAVILVSDFFFGEKLGLWKSLSCPSSWGGGGGGGQPDSF